MSTLTIVVSWVVVLILLFIWRVMMNELNFLSYAYCEALMDMYSTKEFTIATALSLTLTASPMGWLEMCVGSSPAITQIKLHLV